MRYSWLTAAALLLGGLQPGSSQVVVEGKTKLAGMTTLAASGTLSSGPQIASTGVNTISMTGASVYWATNQPPLAPYSCYVNYGPTSHYGQTSSTTQYGIIGLTGLTSAATYHYSVKCSNGTATSASPDATFSTLSSIAYNTPRTMLDTDLGVNTYSGISNLSLSNIGFYMQPGYAASTSAGTGFVAMDNSAGKLYYGLLDFAGPPSQHGNDWIPYLELQAYNAEEVNAGRPPLLVTASYSGISYPELFVADGNDRYNAKQQFAAYDPRLVRFMVNEYGRKTMEAPTYPDVIVSPYYPHSYVGSDEGNLGYTQGLFQVYPSATVTGTVTSGSTSVNGLSSTTNLASGQTIVGPGIPDNTTISSISGSTLTLSNSAKSSGSISLTAYIACSSGCQVTPWDQPFPQTDAQYLNMMQSMMFQWNQIGPDVPFLIDEGSGDLLTANTDAWANVFGQFAALNREGWLSEPMCLTASCGFSSADFYWTVTHFTWFLANGGLVEVRISPDGSTSTLVENAIIPYLLFKNGNSFVNLVDNTAGQSIPQSSYQAMYDALGKPTAVFTVNGSSCNSSGQWECVFSRTFEGGIIYFNDTGSTQTITLPAGAWYLNNSGSAVTSISLANGSAAYVSNQEGTFTSIPTYYPPTTGQTITGPISVSLSDVTSGATICYTTDGSTPTASGGSCTHGSTYSSPFTLSANATVSAIGSKSGTINSYVKIANYQVSSAPPSAQFLLATDTASPFFPETWATIQLSNPSAAAVTVPFAVTGTTGVTFSPASGTVTFQPLETVKSVALSASLNSGAASSQSITATLGTPTNATLGSQTTYRYTIQRDPVSTIDLFANLHPSDEANLRSDEPTTVYNNTGQLYYMGVYNTSTPEYMRTLWKFDLSSIPSNATINSAWIEGSYEATTDSSGTGIFISAYRMTSNWTNSSATWNNSGGNSADYTSTPSATNNMNCGSSNSPTSVFLTGCYLDVTGDVQKIVNGTYPNYGWMLQLANESGATGPEYFQWFTNNWKDSQGNHIWGPITSLLVTYTVSNP